MLGSKGSRKVSDLAEDLNALRGTCEYIADALAGLSFLFGASAALILAGGWWTREPLFAIGAGIALAATVAFGATALAAARASKAAPSIQPAYTPTRLETAKEWRRAA